MKIYNYVNLKKGKFLSVKNYGSIKAAFDNESLKMEEGDPNYNRVAYLMARDGQIVTKDFMLIKNELKICKKKL